MSKITIDRNEETSWVTVSQVGSVGLRLHDSDLRGLIDSIRDKELQNICYNGRFGVSESAKSVIIYDLHKGKTRVCITLTRDQATRLAKALESSFDEEINSYSYKHG